MQKTSLIKLICSGILVAGSFTNIKAQGIITTWIGNGTPGYSGDGGPSNLAQINHPYGIDFDNAGNFYIADQGNFAIRKINAGTGVITTIAGNGAMGFSGDGGPATAAQLGELYDICVDAANNIYLTDWNRHVVRKIDGVTGNITTIAGNGTAGYSGDNGAATAAQMNQPEGLCLFGGNLYITDKIGNNVRKLNLTTGIITTAVGTGVMGYTGDGGAATSCTLSGPSAICVNPAGDLFIADEDNVVVRKVSATTGIISTIAGTGVYGWSGNGGPATSATLGFIQGICIDPHGDLYITDASCSCRKITASTGVINIVAGSDTVDGYSGDGGPATAGLMYNPTDICVDPLTGTMIIADYENNRIRKATQTTYAGPTKTSYISEGAKPSIYPNPASGKLFIQLPANKLDYVAEIFSVSGEQVFTGNMNKNINDIDISSLPDGYYLISLRSSDGGKFTQKIIISK